MPCKRTERQGLRVGHFNRWKAREECKNVTMTNHQHIKNWLIMADPWQGTGKLQRRVDEWRGMGYGSGDCGM